MEVRSSMTVLLALLAAAVVLPPLALFAFQERLLFFPQPPAPAAERALTGRGALPVELHAADDIRVRGWFEASPQGRRRGAVMYFGGNAEEASWVLFEERRPRDPAWLVLNYRGYGRSEGAPGQAALVADAVLAYDWLAARADIDPRRIVAFGRSLGTGVAVQLAARRPLAGVVLVTPYDSVSAVARARYPLYPVQHMLRHPFDSLAQAPRLTAPLLCAVAAGDEIIPPAHARRLFDAWAGPKDWLLLPGTDHNSIVERAALWDRIRAFAGTHG